MKTLPLLMLTVPLLLFGISCVSSPPLTSIGIEDYQGFIPVDPPDQSLSYEEVMINGATSTPRLWDKMDNREINEKLPLQYSTTTYQKIDTSALVSATVKYLTTSGASVKEGNYIVIFDYAKFYIKPVIDAATKREIGDEKIGVGVRIKTFITILEAGVKTGVNIHTLGDIAVAASEAKLKGNISVEVIGIDSPKVLKEFPIILEIDEAAITKIETALSEIKTEISPVTTTVTSANLITQTKLTPYVLARRVFNSGRYRVVLEKNGMVCKHEDEMEEIFLSDESFTTKKGDFNKLARRINFAQLFEGITPTAKDYFYLGLDYYHNDKNYQAAIDCFKQALEARRHDYPAVLIAEARVLNDWGKYDEAIKACDIVLSDLKGGGKYIEAWLTKGDALKMLRDYGKAIETYQKGIDKNEAKDLMTVKSINQIDTTKNPVCAALWYNKACAHSLRGEGTDDEEAIKCLKKAIELNPKHKHHAQEDPDFKRLYNNAEFKKLVGK